MDEEIKRDLGLLDVICISAGVMISSGLFILPYLAYMKAGPAMIIAYVIASIIIIPSVLSKAELVTAMPKMGGIFFFTDRSMGPLMGTIGGLVAWVSLAFKSAFSLLAMGLFMVLFFPDIESWQTKLVATLFCLAFTFINLLGAKVTSRVQVFVVVLLFIALTLYVVFGLFHVQKERFFPFAPFGLKGIFEVVALVFVAFSGTSKIAAVSGEVKDPGRNLPLGMFYSLGLVSVLYIAVVTVTVGVLDGNIIQGSFVPLSLGGEKIFGAVGLVVMSLAAIAAFISTGNAGLLAASRDTTAMGKDDLLPPVFGHISSRGTPWFSIIVTSGFMIVVIWFLDIETFAKTASALKLLLFMLTQVALIVMREGKVKHYRPRYVAPFYPWIQIAALLIYGFLLTQMGVTPLLIVGGFVLFSIAWYYIFAYGKIKREYGLLHLIERVTGVKNTDKLLEEELREIIVERDDLSRERFCEILKHCTVIDLQESVSDEALAGMAAKALAIEFGTDEARLKKRLLQREKEPEVVIKEGLACLSLTIKGMNKFGVLLVHDKEGITFSGNGSHKINTAFVIVHTNDQWVFNIKALAWLLEIVGNPLLFDKCNINGGDSLRENLSKAIKEEQ